MKSDSTPSEKENETRPGSARLPEWLVILLGLMIFTGIMYLDRYGGGMDRRVYEPDVSYSLLKERWPKSNLDPDVAEGKQHYAMFCAPCHQANGSGATGVAPPLVGSEWVLSETPERIVRIVLNGLQGPIQVKGQEWNLVMLPWKDTLTDRQIATILSFIRQNPDWEGHQASKVSEAEVAAIREATKTRNTSWTAPELEAIPLGAP